MNVNKQLFTACETGNIEAIKNLVSNGLDITVNGDDRGGIIDDCMNSHQQTLKILMYWQGGDKARNNHTIELASKNGHLEVVKYLTSIGVDVTNVNNQSLQCACRNGHLEIAKYLVSVGATDTFGQALQVASQNGHLEVVKYLVSIGGDGIVAKDSAITHGHLEIVKYLVSIGINVIETDRVQIASLYGCLDIVKYLVSLGADVVNDSTSISWASRKGHIKVVEYLLSVGADFTKLSSKHQTYFRQKKAYTRWRKIRMRKWIRKVLIPWYYSPENPGGIKAKKEITNVLNEFSKLKISPNA